MRIRGLCKLLYGRDWLWVKLGLALVVKAILNTFLIQFSADGWSCVPSLQFGLNGGNGDLLQKDLCEHASAPSSVVVSDPDPVAGHCLTHASAGDTRALTGKPDSACCEVIAPFPGS